MLLLFLFFIFGYGYKIMYLMRYFLVEILLKFYNITNNTTEDIFVRRSPYTYTSIL